MDTKPEERCSPVSDPWSRVLETRIGASVASKALNRGRQAERASFPLRVAFREVTRSRGSTGLGPVLGYGVVVGSALARADDLTGQLVSTMLSHPDLTRLRS